VTDSLAVYVPGQAVMPAIVVLVALVGLSNKAKNQGWIS